MPVQISPDANKSHQILKTLLRGHSPNPVRRRGSAPSRAVPPCLCVQHHKYPAVCHSAIKQFADESSTELRFKHYITIYA